MVLLQRRGVERHPALLILLSIVTFGLYLPYWYYQSHKELYDQFELDEDRRDMGALWLIYGFVAVKPLLFVYEWIFASNVMHVRKRMGMDKHVAPGLVIGLTITAMIVGVVLMTAAYIVFLTGTADIDPDASDEEAAEQLLESLVVAVPLFFLSLVVPIALRLVAYALLQGSLNQLWRHFDVRLQELSATEDEPPLPEI